MKIQKNKSKPNLRPPLWHGLKPSELLKALAKPPERYRPVPALLWSGSLDWPTLRGQLQGMYQQAVREFIFWPVYGVETPYMSFAFWERLEQIMAFCRAQGMKYWISDSYNWPAGACAGQLLRDHPEYAEKNLRIRPVGHGDKDVSSSPGSQNNGKVVWETKFYESKSYQAHALGADWCLGIMRSLDVLSLEGTKRFIESTHEKYFRHFGKDFGQTIHAAFCDETAFHANSQKAGDWGVFPYTDDLFPSFQSRYGYDLKECLEDLIMDTPSARRTRCHFWRWVAERYGEAFFAQQRAWYDHHQVVFTVDLDHEEFPSRQVFRHGDMWEVLRHAAIPGVDSLSNGDGFNYPYRITFYTPATLSDRRAFHLPYKLVHAVARHSGKREVLSEAFQACDWGINLFRQKCGFNYQLALGATLFSDATFFTSVADFRKYGSSGKHFTQPWWPFYHLYVEYNARLAALHAEGEPMAEIAVLYPRSTVWSHCGTNSTTELAPLETQIYELLDELIRRQWHFDFIFEPVLSSCRIEGSELVASHARYRALVVPSATDLPQGCVDILTRFAKAGGILIFSGNLPEREVDSQTDLSSTLQRLLNDKIACHVGPAGAGVCTTLEKHLRRPLVIHGEKEREFVSSWRRLAGNDIFFVANMSETPSDVELTVDAKGSLMVWDPDTLKDYRPQLKEGNTFRWHFDPWQAYVIMDGKTAALQKKLSPSPSWWNPSKTVKLDGSWEFITEPDNMMLLSCHARPDPENRGLTEGWHKNTGAEGWIVPPDGRRLPASIHPKEAPWYWLRARVDCEVPESVRFVVCDNPDFLEVYVNGKCAEQIEAKALWAEENVWFDVQGLLAKGENFIHIRARTSKYNDPRVIGYFSVNKVANILQPAVITGKFSVQENRLARWTGKMEADKPWEKQGLPHFSGTGIFRRKIEFYKNEGRILLRLPKCTDAVEVRVNGMSCGKRAWYPYVFEIKPNLRKGKNMLEIRVNNTLGNLITETFYGFSPTQFPESGLLRPPELLFL